MQTRILIVEDSPTQAEVLRGLLEGSGYAVAVATSGEDGLERFATVQPDIVVSDIVMPGRVDGYELCRRIKEGARSSTPVVLLTSLADPMDIIRGLECGADNFFTKPYDAAHLLERLQLLLATRRARARDRVHAGIRVVFMGREFTVSAEREQILDLLVTTFEEAVRQNHELRQREDELTVAQAQLARYARSLEARLESILNSVPDVLFSVSSDLKDVYYVSPAVRAVFGCEPQEFTLEYWTRHIHSNDRELALHAFRHVAETREPQALEHRLVAQPATLRWIATTLIPSANGDGRGRIDGIARDVTEQKKLEEQLRQAQKMEAVGRLAGGVAHDFNNLLSAMFVELDLGLADVPADHPVVETLQQVRRAAEQAAGLTRQLLAFSRRQVLEPTVFNLNELIGDSERLLRRLIGEDVELTTRSAPELGSVRADRGQIEQVLVNLVVNSRDAMPEGGKLVIETANTVLDAEYTQQHTEAALGPHVVLTVTDTGTGMSEEVRSHIFEPFFTTKEHGKGTGLGLATSYGIVKQAGGHIGVYSEPGLGTTFRVYLPRVEATGVAPPRRTPVATRRGTETILLVEDSALLRGATTRILRAHGYRVLEAADGDEALKLLADSSEPLHLLLSDVVLPGIPGREVAKRVRAARPDIKLLFVSGYTDDVVTHQRLADEGMAFLQKPYTQETLTRKVREVLEAAPSA